MRLPNASASRRETEKQLRKLERVPALARLRRGVGQEQKKCGTKGPHLAMYHAEVIELSEPRPARKTIDRVKLTHLLDDRPWVMSDGKLNG